MVFLIDISNLDSHLFEMLSQTSDNLYIYMADLERIFPDGPNQAWIILICRESILQTRRTSG